MTEPCCGETDPILCPNVQEPQVSTHMKDVYGLEVTKIKRLNGYDDYNVHICVAGTHSNPHITTVETGGYFVKISNINDSENPKVLDAQLAAMQHLVEKGIPCQSAVKSLIGQDFTDITVTDRKGNVRIHKVSVRTYLAGEIMASVTLTKELLFDAGKFVANVTKALESFQHPFYDTFDCQWSMNNTPLVKEITSAVTDDRHRRVCEEVLKAFDEEVIPRKSLFRKGQVHGDLNEQNILVNQSPQGVKVCGLLDFQDCCRSHPLYDLAIFAGYMMMVRETDVPRPQMPGHVLAGYCSVMDLNEAESEAFHTVVASRMVMSLAYGAHYYAMDPTNEYLLETAKAGWDALMLFWETPRGSLEADWKAIRKA